MTNQKKHFENDKIEKKRVYHTPKMERIGEVRDLTRGSSGFNADNGTRYGDDIPSQPGGGSN